MLKRHWGLLATAAIFAAGSASAQQADLDKVEQMQRQMQQLQDQMKQVKIELTEAKKKAAEVKSEIPAAFNGAYGADLKPFPTKAPSILDKVKITWGGFLAAETVWRQHNTVSDMGTPFNAIPYPFSPQFGENEFRGSARATRLSLLVEGVLTPTQKLSGYYEMDFLGVGVTSNYNQSNSWAPRLRQGYFTYDNADWGFHFLGGQAWSLLTQNTIGITPRKENVPLTIEANYVAGFDYTRNWQLRVVQDWGTWASFGVSVEAPAELVYSSAGAVPNGGIVNQTIVNFTDPGNSFLGSGAFANNFTSDVAPDIIGKAAFDPGWGHYEVFGLARFFNDGIFHCAAAGLAPTGVCSTSTAAPAFPGQVPGTQGEHTTTGGGVGGSVLLPILPKFLDVQASTMYGRGIGRYGASNLSDVVVGPDGTLVPLTAWHGLVGGVLHPWAGLDIYAYAGLERTNDKLFNVNPASSGALGGIIGYGNPFATNGGCNIVNAVSYSTTPASFATSNCAAVNKTVSSVTVGLWQDLYKGPMGRVAAGLEWELIHRDSFASNVTPGIIAAAGLPATTIPFSGPVSVNDNVIMTSLRWYPF
jgi:hypothetical protein